MQIQWFCSSLFHEAFSSILDYHEEHRYFQTNATEQARPDFFVGFVGCLSSGFPTRTEVSSCAPDHAMMDQQFRARHLLNHSPLLPWCLADCLLG